MVPRCSAFVLVIQNEFDMHIGSEEFCLIADVHEHGEWKDAIK